jgi:hypothetical protein
LAKNWKNYRQKLQKIFFDEIHLKAIFKHFKIDVSSDQFGVSSKEYQDLVTNAKFIRNRFTCLDLDL